MNFQQEISAQDLGSVLSLLKVKVAQSCPSVCDLTDCSLPASSVHGTGKSTGVDCHFLLQGIFPTQGSNPGLPHCRQILYQLSHQGSPKMQLNVVLQPATNIIQTSGGEPSARAVCEHSRLKRRRNEASPPDFQLG